MKEFELFGLKFIKSKYGDYDNNLGFRIAIMRMAVVEYVVEDYNTIVELWNHNYQSSVNFKLQHNKQVILETDLDILRNEECLQYLILCKERAKEELKSLKEFIGLHESVISLDLRKYEILL